MAKFDRKQIRDRLVMIDEALASSPPREVSEHDVDSLIADIQPPQSLVGIYRRKLTSLRSGELELHLQEFSDLLANTFSESNIIYLRATSLIHPNIWQNNYMIKYGEDQRYNARILETLDNAEREQLRKILAEVLSKRDIRSLGDADFERTFIITNEQIADLRAMVDLIHTICDQSEYMDLRLCYEEDLVPQHRRDLGIAVSKDGEIWLYELITLHNTLHGGKLIANDNYLRDAASTYRTVQTQSQPIPRNSTFETVVSTINSVTKKSLDLNMLRGIRSQRVATSANKCLSCFRESERTIKAAKWHNFPDDRKVWYEMFQAENDAVLKFVESRQPRRIIEIGCGPGRFIDLFVNMGLDRFQEIVGIDCDSEMYKECSSRFRGYSPKIKILRMEVRYDLPYDDNHYDFAINAMNIVGWQDNEIEWLKEMLRAAKCLFFTVYKRGTEELRMKMYQRRPHETSELGLHLNSDGEIVLGDCAVMPNIKSKSYTADQVQSFCDALSAMYDCTYKIDDESNKLLHLCTICKTQFLDLASSSEFS